MTLLIKGLRSLQSVINVINREPKILLDKEDSTPFNQLHGDIKLDNVSFGYHNREDNVLEDLTMTIQKGKTTAIVGISGSGKSTIVKLIQRFYDPVYGAIYANSEDLRLLNLRQYRQKIGYVGQEPVLFNQTIRENMLNAKPDATEEEIVKALKDSIAYDFIAKLPNGLDSEVGDIGGKLSGGQKQRIAIARALLRKPEVLILDEATSALDKNNEKRVQDAIKRIRDTYDMTIVVIAHRLTTIKDADVIYVIDKGKVVECGDHNLLMKSESIYSNFFNAQSRISYMETNDGYSSVSVHGTFESESTALTEDLRTSNDRYNLENQGIYARLGSAGIFFSLLKYNTPKILILVSLMGAVYISCCFV